MCIIVLIYTWVGILAANACSSCLAKELVFAKKLFQHLIYLTCRKHTEFYECSKMHHSHPESELKSIWEELFYVTKKNDELDLSSYYIIEEVWLLGISVKYQFPLFRGGQKDSWYLTFLLCKIVLHWYPAKQ